MADSPIIFKRTKGRPGQRTRDVSPERGQNAPAAEQGGGESPITLASKLKSKAKRTKLKSKLSFGEEDEEESGDAFQIKKSNLSRKLTLGQHPAQALPATLDQATISTRVNGAPVYDQAYLSELKASTPSDSDNVIPSESSIIAAKQKRDRLRAVGPESDYISLSVTKRDDLPQGPHPESRLMREEDELGEGEDEYAVYTGAQERIALGKKQKKKEASNRRGAMVEMIADAEEEDEETMEWEQEQLRRGGHTAADFMAKAPEKQVYKAAPIPPSTAIPALGPAVDRLAQSLAALTTSHAKNTGTMSSLADELDQLSSRETELRTMINTAEDKRSWFVAFKERIESIATFLDEKFPQLEKLEDEHVSILGERWDMFSQRRRADDEDDLSFVFGILPVQVQPESDETDELGRIVPRSNPAVLRRERQGARISRRTRRQSKAPPSQVKQEEEGYSTDSSLPPSDFEDYRTAMQRLLTDGQSILSDVRADEFKDPRLGLAKWFGEWRGRFADSYTGAWGGLGLVGAWEFWVRLEVLGWNPFEVSKSLDEFTWYSSLYDYSRPHDKDDEEPELGPDGDLVSAMTSTAIVPRVCKLIEGGAFDPYSDRDTRRIIDLTEQVEASIGEDNHKFQMILKSVYTVFESAVIATESLLAPFIAQNRPAFDPEAVPARQRFLSRRIKLLEAIVRWRKYTREKFGIGELCAKLVRNCILPVAESGWQVGGEEKYRTGYIATRVCSFSKVLFGLLTAAPPMYNLFTLLKPIS
ncbi:hypothetical protein SERLA73DRAFT_123779 [Serpula lacrymans var. lacrymans S7.3]|uniref:GCF C-terminal domain-containing protein n=1 Tax=Serpula lacrymans var. lacrymans (strain S7.3) TaxID=936435 RepID=F8Q006_SERL3|nr:hypothetical protein SERLA73DRAFT_123779 [Serpula lacrymans var. lacrymans S7.3]